MPNFSFACTECPNKVTLDCDRDLVPKTLACELCGAVMKRSVKPAGSSIEKDMEPPTQTETLRNNLKGTEEKIKGLEDKTVGEGLKKWRQELTGGRY